MSRFVAVLFLVTGCFSPTAPAGRPCSASGECPGDLMCSPQNTCEQTLTDAPPRIDAAFDALIDAAPDAPGTQLVAHYRLDGTLDDVTTMHPATAVGSVSYAEGFTNQALHLPHAATSHVVVADSPAFDLPSGRIELRFKYSTTAPAGDIGLFSRDASGTDTDGHFSLRLGHDRRVVLRIQQQSNPTVEAYRCTSQPMSANSWHHVEATFGPSGLVLRTDGGVVSGTTWTNESGDVLSCTTSWTRGIAGNDNPIVIGALSVTSADGTGSPVIAVAGDVDLDDIKIWSLP